VDVLLMYYGYYPAYLALLSSHWRSLQSWLRYWLFWHSPS
jgi:hypothetical protein